MHASWAQVVGYALAFSWSRQDGRVIQCSVDSEGFHTKWMVTTFHMEDMDILSTTIKHQLYLARPEHIYGHSHGSYKIYLPPENCTLFKTIKNCWCTSVKQTQIETPTFRGGDHQDIPTINSDPLFPIEKTHLRRIPQVSPQTSRLLGAKTFWSFPTLAQDKILVMTTSLCLEMPAVRAACMANWLWTGSRSSYWGWVVSPQGRAF